MAAKRKPVDLGDYVESLTIPELLVAVDTVLVEVEVRLLQYRDAAFELEQGADEGLLFATRMKARAGETCYESFKTRIVLEKFPPQLAGVNLSVDV